MTAAGAGDRVLPRALGPAPPPRPIDPGLVAPIGRLAFLGVTVASLGGPLALAALYVPGVLGEASASESAGLVTVAAAVAFGVPLLVWLRCSRQITSSGGLYGFVAAAAGRRVGLLQAGLWTASYLLYLIYTTAFIVYDTLPTVLPGIRPYRAALEIALPVALATVMLAGRAATLVVLGGLAAGQMLLLTVLAVVTIGHDAPASAFAAHPPAAALGTATGQVALLYVCGSLPLFLGGELARPSRTVRRGLTRRDPYRPALSRERVRTPGWRRPRRPRIQRRPCRPEPRPHRRRGPAPSPGHGVSAHLPLNRRSPQKSPSSVDTVTSLDRPVPVLVRSARC